jgi:hypothetical protein
MPPPPPGPPGPPPSLPPDEPSVPDTPARPGWRTVMKRQEPGARRKGKAAAAAAAAAAAPPPPPPHAIEAPRPELPSWAQWRRKHIIYLHPVLQDFTLAPAFNSESQRTTCHPRPHALAGCRTSVFSSGTLWYVLSPLPVSFIRADIDLQDL